jgi:serine protease Do
MSENQFVRRVWIFVLTGIIIGLLIGAGMEWTKLSTAQSASSGSEAAVNQVNTGNTPEVSVAEQLSNVFASVAQKVNPSVVTIFTETTIKMRNIQTPGSPFDEFFGDEFFKRFFQVPENKGDFKQQGLGSGVIVDKNGILLTNNHVVDGADNIKVRLMDGREFEGKVKGTDPQTDLAVITIDAKDLIPIQIGDSDKSRVGEWVLAIGSPLNPQLEHTVTAGIISAKGRSGVGLTQYEDYIQTDAAINPGNSGGALVNLRSELIGINSAIATQTGGNMGIGFAIPANLAKKVMQDIISSGKVTRGWLGVYIQNITPDLAKALKLEIAKGAIVSKVQENSPAERAGLKEEDVIVGLNGKEVSNTVELSTWVAATTPGSKITLNILRNGEQREISVKVGELNPKSQELAQGESNYEKIGLQVSNLTPELKHKYQFPENQEGVVITAVDPNGISAQAGLQVGDVILKVNRENVDSVQDFDDILAKVKAGGNILFYLRRGAGNLFIAFTMPEK